MIQIMLPAGKTPDNKYNIDRDMAHVFDKLVRQVVLDLPEDSVVPRPSVEELQRYCDTFQEIFQAVYDPQETPETVLVRYETIPDPFRAVFERALARSLFKRFVGWRRAVMPKKVVAKLDVE